MNRDSLSALTETLLLGSYISLHHTSRICLLTRYTGK